MKEMIFLAVGVSTFRVIAQNPISPPLVPDIGQTPMVLTSINVSTPEFASGALCRSYRVGGNYDSLRSVLEAFSGAVPLDQDYDTTSFDFDGQKINKHGCNLFVWGGFFMAKRAGRYTFLLGGFRGSCNMAQVCIGDQVLAASCNGPSVREVELAKGANKIRVLLYVSGNSFVGGYYQGNSQSAVPVLEYRFSSSVKPAKKITPSMLYHEVVEEENW